MSAVKDLFDQIMKAIDKKTKKAGTNYTGKVTRVEGDTAFVQFDGSAINDTPVKLSIDAKPGDSVRIMVQGGKAWLTGNDTAPPTNDTAALRDMQDETSHIRETANQVAITVGNKMNSDMSNRPSSIVVDSGKIEFKSNTLVVDSDNFKLEEDGDAIFSGTLDAAGGTFAGDVVINKDSQVIEIGNNTPTGIHIHNSTNYYKTKISSGAISFEESVETDQYWHFIQLTHGEMSIWTFSSGHCTYDHLGAHPSSDRRLKKDIADISPDMARHIHPVRFTFKGDDIVHYGFIAQDVQEFIPGAVRKEKDGYLSLNYQELIAPLYALAQEQEERIKQLEDRIDMLERRMDDGK